MIPKSEKFDMFRNRLLKVYKHISKTARRQNISCFRIYDHDLPEFPFCIEQYADKIYLAEYRRRHSLTEEEHEDWLEKCEEIVGTVCSVPPEMIFLKTRQRKAGRQGQYNKFGQMNEFFPIAENGLKFLVNLTDYLDTGLFLDHRITRAIVRDKSAGKRVLNLFCYTGSFSVYAAAGNAATVTSVDLSNTYLQWAKDNFKLNGFIDPEKFLFVQADVLQYLPQLEPETFDLIVIDPPTFSNSKKMKDFLDIQRDHVTLLNNAIEKLTPGGIIFFSTNYSKFALNSGEIQASSIKDITKPTTPFDFQGKLKRYCFEIVK